MNKDTINKFKRYKSDFGVYQIEESKLSFQMWIPGLRCDSYIQEGTILDDTTFRINELYEIKFGRKKFLSKREELFRFKPFQPKPDSTNNFIK